jgi:hypothetical protein
MKHLFWKGYTQQERTHFLQTIQPVIAPFGDIVDFKLFSDLAITITIEIRECNINLLYQALEAHLYLDPVNLFLSHSSREQTLFLNISFSSGRGDLQVEVPAVPG